MTLEVTLSAISRTLRIQIRPVATGGNLRWVAAISLIIASLSAAVMTFSAHHNATMTGGDSVAFVLALVFLLGSGKFLVHALYDMWGTSSMPAMGENGRAWYVTLLTFCALVLAFAGHWSWVEMSHGHHFATNLTVVIALYLPAIILVLAAARALIVLSNMQSNAADARERELVNSRG